MGELGFNDLSHKGMITTKTILDALTAQGDYSGLDLPVQLQITNDPPEFVDIEFHGVQVIEGVLVISATVNEDEECAECYQELGQMHEPSCGKRTVDCPEVVSDDCHLEDEGDSHEEE